MEKISSQAAENTVEVSGLYLNKYQQIVKPNRRFLIPNYFIQHWVSRLGPTLAWIVISLQQACWRADDDHCTLAQATMAEEIGIHRHTVSKELHKNGWRHWFIPQIEEQPGLINKKRETYQPLPHKYTVYLVTPLIPEHLAGLYVYFQKQCPAGTAAEIKQAVKALLELSPKEALTCLEAQVGASERSFEAPLSVAEVAALATGLDLGRLPAATVKKLEQKLAGLESHLTETGGTICRQYFRQTWVPLLGPPLAWLVTIIRSRCYFNPDSGELRDVNTWPKKELAAHLGQSTQNLKHLLAHPYAGHFIQILDQNKRRLTLRVSLAREPLPDQSADQFWCRQGQGASGSGQACGRIDKNSTSPPVESIKVRHDPPVKSIKVRHDPPRIDKSSTHESTLKDSVLSIDDDRISKGSQTTLKKMLSEAGLSGTGLSRLCHKKPTLELQPTKAVILYAEARGLGPGYIYRHLDRGARVEEIFLQLAALEPETLELFRAALGELKQGGRLTARIRTPIRPDRVDLFIGFAQAFAGFEPEAVREALGRGEAAFEGTGAADGQRGPAGEAAGPTQAEASLGRFWTQVLTQLETQMTTATFEAWVKETRLIGREGSSFTVAVANPLAKDWLEHRLMTVIRRTVINLVRTVEGHTPGEVEIVFVVRDDA